MNQHAILVLFLLSMIVPRSHAQLIIEYVRGNRTIVYREYSREFHPLCYKSDIAGRNLQSEARIYRGSGPSGFALQVGAGSISGESDYFIHYTVGSHPYSTASTSDTLSASPGLFEIMVDGALFDKGTVYFDTPLAMNKWLLLSGRPLHLKKDSVVEIRVRTPKGNATENQILIADAFLLDKEIHGPVPPNAVKSLVLHSPKTARLVLDRLSSRIGADKPWQVEDFYAETISWADLNISLALAYEDYGSGIKKAASESLAFYLGWREVLNPSARWQSGLIKGAGYGFKSQAGGLHVVGNDQSFLNDRIGMCRLLIAPHKSLEELLIHLDVASRRQEINAVMQRRESNSELLLNEILFIPSLDLATAAHFAGASVTTTDESFLWPWHRIFNDNTLPDYRRKALISLRLRHWLTKRDSAVFLSLFESTGKDRNPTFADPYLLGQVVRRYVSLGKFRKAHELLSSIDADVPAFTSDVRAALDLLISCYSGEEPMDKALQMPLLDEICRTNLKHLYSPNWRPSLASIEVLSIPTLDRQSRKKYADNISSVAAISIDVPSNVSFSGLNSYVHLGEANAISLRAGTRFGKAIGKSRESAKSDAIKHMKDHPNNVLSCRLFQDHIADVINLTDPNDRNALCDIVNNNPHSVLGGSICVELIRESIAWPGSISKKDLSELRKSLPVSSLCSVLLTPPGDANALPNEWLDNLYLMVQEATNRYPMFTTIAPSSNLPLEGASYYLRSSALENLCRQTICWLQLRDIESANACLSIAKELWLALKPWSVLSPMPPDDQYSLFRLAKESVENATASGFADVSQSKNAEEAISKYLARLNVLTKLMALTSSVTDTPETLSFKAWTFSDRILQYYLNDMVAAIRSKASYSLILKYYTSFNDEMALYLSKQETVAALGWLNKEVAASLEGGAKREYLAFLADAYYRSEDQAEATRVYEHLASSFPGTAEALYSLERLAAIYLDFWKLPDRALSAQKTIQEGYPNTIWDYQSRMAAAKILYDQKEYDKAAFELSVLLEKDPSKSRDKPVRTMLGLSYLALGRYEQARNEFASVINSDTGQFREKCLYLMGYTYICEQRYSDSIKPFQDLITAYPTSSYAEKAKAFIERLAGSVASN